MTRTITALFETRADAETARERIVAAGIPQAAISIIPGQDTTYSATGHASYDYRRDEGGFWASLKDLFLPDEDRYAYAEGMSRGGVLLTAKVEEAHATSVSESLRDAGGAIDLDAHEATWRSEGWTGYQPAASAGTVGTVGATGAALNARTSGNAAAYAKTGAHETGAHETGSDEVIPIVEERLSVGKRVAEAGQVRIRSYVVETPVQEQVTLRNEHVEIDRRTVDRPVTPADEKIFAERTIEATSRSEIPVVNKDVRVTGEIGLKTSVDERTETVSDKVRRTEVEVEDERGEVTRTGTGERAR